MSLCYSVQYTLCLSEALSTCCSTDLLSFKLQRCVLTPGCRYSKCLPSSRRGCHSAPKLCNPLSFTVESVELEAGVRRPSLRMLEARGGCLDFRTPMWLDACFGCYRSSAPPQQNVRTALANNRASMRTARSVESACSWCRASSKTRPGNHKKSLLMSRWEIFYRSLKWRTWSQCTWTTSCLVCTTQGKCASHNAGMVEAQLALQSTPHTHTHTLSISPSLSTFSWTRTPASATQ